MLDQVLSSTKAQLVSTGDIWHLDYARTLDGRWIPADVAEQDLQGTGSYVTRTHGQGVFLRNWRETHVRLRFESGQQRIWVSRDRDFVHEAMALERALAGRSSSLTVGARLVRVSFTSRTGPRAGETIQYMRLGLCVVH